LYFRKRQDRLSVRNLSKRENVAKVVIVISSVRLSFVFCGAGPKVGQALSPANASDLSGPWNSRIPGGAGDLVACHGVLHFGQMESLGFYQGMV
jgi:hypothetical protein